MNWPDSAVQFRILKDGFGISVCNSQHTEGIFFFHSDVHLHHLWWQRHAARKQSAFSHLPHLPRPRTDSGCGYSCSRAALGNLVARTSSVNRIDQASPLNFSAFRWVVQLSGAFCLLRSTKNVAVLTTTNSGTAVNSRRAIAVQSVYTEVQSGYGIISANQNLQLCGGLARRPLSWLS